MESAIDCVHLEELKGLQRLLEYAHEKKRRLRSRVSSYNLHHLPSIRPPPIPLLSWKRKHFQDATTTDDNNDDNGSLCFKKQKIIQTNDAELEKDKPMKKLGWWSKYKPCDIVALDTEMVTLSKKKPNESKFAQSAASIAVVSMEKMQTLYHASFINNNT